MIKLGRISYVNMAPVFYRVDASVEEVQGVPTALNELLLRGELDAGRTGELLDEMRATGLPT